MTADRLFHFTCADHGYAALRKRGHLRPFFHPLLNARLIWLTTEGAPDRDSTGLTQELSPCDRMAYRYVVTDLSRCVPWLDSEARKNAPSNAVTDLEVYGDPEHWWVAEEPVLARLG